MIKIIETGSRFGKLSVIGMGTLKYRGQVTWDCVCDCGGVKTVPGNALRFGKVKSCGCMVAPNHNHGAGFTAYWRRYAQGAKRRGYTFSISADLFYELSQSPCYYCGREPDRATIYKRKNHKDHTFVAGGVDRLDNSIGYEPENVVPCCSDCNYAKREMSYTEFMDLIRRIYEKQTKT